jgi:hypothetical protein
LPQRGNLRQFRAKRASVCGGLGTESPNRSQVLKGEIAPHRSYNGQRRGNAITPEYGNSEWTREETIELARRAFDDVAIMAMHLRKIAK